METTERTRSIKVLLIFMTDIEMEKSYPTYYRLIDPTKDELYMLNDAHGKTLHGNEYINANDVGAIEGILIRLGRIAPTEIATVEGDPSFRKWSESEIELSNVKDFMGWDRVYVVGINV